MVAVVDDGVARDELLGRPSLARGAALLEGLGFQPALARSFAAEAPVGRVLDVVVHARGRKNPAGHARRALELDWKVPKATGQEVDDLLVKLRADAIAVEGRLQRLTGGMGLGGQKIERLPGESDDDWLRRIQETRRKEVGS